MVRVMYVGVMREMQVSVPFRTARRSTTAQQMVFPTAYTRLLLLLLLIPLVSAVPIADREKRFDRTFDYVVVGGGTAGLTIANRLSEDKNVSVAVIEAGTFYQVTNPLLGGTPAGDTIFAGADPADSNPLVDWRYGFPFLSWICGGFGKWTG